MRTGYAVKALIGASVGAALLIGPTVRPGHATAVTFTGSGTGERSASVTFDTLSILGVNYLTVVLTNTGNYDASSSSQILAAVFFSLPGNPALSKTAGFSGAYLNALNNSDVKYGPEETNLGTEWAYRSGLNVGGFTYGLSSANLGLFDANHRFLTCSDCDLQGPDSPNGIQYGITTKNDTGGNDGDSIEKQELVRNSVIFALGNITQGFDPKTSITSVRFQYGTDISENYFGNGGGNTALTNSLTSSRVPYPSSLALIGFGALGAAVLVARRRRLAVSRVRS
jgi:hypothetical protein